LNFFIGTFLKKKGGTLIKVVAVVFCSECSLFTVSNTVTLFMFHQTVNSIHTVPPVGNSTEFFLICFLLECFWMWTLHVDIQFPAKKFSVKTVDCMFCMQIPVKLKHKSLCSFCNVSNSQCFATWCTLIDWKELVKWKRELFFDRII